MLRQKKDVVKSIRAITRCIKGKGVTCYEAYLGLDAEGRKIRFTRMTRESLAGAVRKIHFFLGIPLTWRRGSDYAAVSKRKPEETDSEETSDMGAAFVALISAGAGMGARFVPGKDAMGNATHVYGFTDAPVIDGNQQQGGIFSALIQSDDTVTFSGLVMRRDKAPKGGAILMEYGKLKASYLKFQGNRADDFGGAVCVDGGRAEMSECMFLDNGADHDARSASVLVNDKGNALRQRPSTFAG